MIARAAGWALALCVMSCAACGHYGPPVRSQPEAVGREEPKADPAASETNSGEQERDRHEP
jgi:hypothetical protein